MPAKAHTYCHYCGSQLASPPVSSPVCQECGKTNYRNPLPVAVVLQPVDGGVVLIRRGQGHGRQQLALPGGYIGLDETWQQAAARELAEETGILIAPEDLELADVLSGGRNKDRLMVFGVSKKILTAAELPPFVSHAEASERLVVNEPVELAFNTHYQVLKKYFATRSGGVKPDFGRG